jgi:hypothetical protein
MSLKVRRIIALVAALAVLTMLPLGALARLPSAPDVSISSSDINFSNDFPKAGETVVINVTVHNIGDTEATAVSVNFYTDIILFSTKDITRIAPNATGTATTNWPATLPKTYTIIVNCTADGNPGNNQAQKVITVTTGGTLDVKSTVDPGSVSPEQAFWVNGTVKLATQAVANAPVTVAIKTQTGAPVGTPGSGTTDAGGDFQINMTAPATAGRYEVETSTSTGTLKGNDSKTLDVILPDLVIMDVAFSNDKPTDGDQITITAILKNNGTNAVATVEVAFYYDSNKIGSKKYGPLEAGNSTQVSTGWTAVKGTHQMKVVADPNAKVNEMNEDDNAMTVPLTVKEKAGGMGGNTAVLLIAAVVVVIAVALVAVMFMRRRRAKE